jgi:hypothetical protein
VSFNRLSVATALIAVVAAGVVPLASASAGPSRSATKYRVSMKISTTRAVANEDTVTLTGTVSPAAPGTNVKVQVRYVGQPTWRKAGSAKVRTNSTYAFSFTPATRRDRTYRVVKPGDDHARADMSRERTLQAIGWVWLSTLKPSRTEDVATITTMPINGEDYGHTLYTGVDTTIGFVEYTLGRHAYELQATYGLSDRTETGGRGTVAVTTDGVPSFSQAFDLGQSVLQTTNVTDTYRIRIDFSQIADTPVTEPSAGAARVLMD